MFVAAQVSLYPLRQANLSPAIGVALSIFREHGLDVSEGTMSTLVSGEDGALFNALRDAFKVSAEQGDVVMVVTVSNACPASP